MANPYKFNNSSIRGLSDNYRKQWEEDNKDFLKNQSEYFSRDDDYKKRVFRLQAIKSISEDRDSIAKYSAFKDDELDQILTAKSNAFDKESGTINHIPATASMKKSSTDLFTDDVDETALKAKGLDFARSAQSLDTSKEQYDLVTLDVATGQEKINKQMLDNNPALRETAIANVKKVAEILSPDYNRYKNTDKLNEEPEQFWSDLAAKYQAFVDAGDDARANRELVKAIQDTVYKNQSTGEIIFNTAAGTIDSAIGVVASTIGVTLALGKTISGYSLIEHAFDSEEEKKEGSYITRVLDDFVDNFWTRQADTITKFGLMQYYDKYLGDEEDQQYAKDLEESGIGRYGLAKGSRNATIPALLELMQQYGFTAGSMICGAGEAALASKLFQGLRWGTKAVRLGGKTLSGKKAVIDGTRKILDKLQKSENWVQKWLIAPLVGTSEGAIEGLNTKEEVEKEGQQKIDEEVQKKIAAEAFNILNQFNPTLIKDAEGRGTTHYYDNNGKEINPLDVYNRLYEKYLNTKEYQDMQDEIKWAANTAGTDNFLINSAINGFINSTLQATMFNESTVTRIKNKRLMKKLEGTRQLVTHGTAGTASASVEYTGLTPLNYLYRYTREPFGELIEEGSQTESNVFTKGAAMHSIDTFIENRLNGDGTMQVGESLTKENLSAAFKALGDQDMGELWYSMGAGAFTSIVGGVHKVRRGYGDVKRDSNGNIIRDKDGNVQYERTWFSKGYKADGTKESWFDVASRMTPWRSGLFTNIRETYVENDLYKRRAAALTKYVQDPKNLEKLDGLAGTNQWQKLMNKAAINNDEFNFRSAQKGKLVNDVIMLESLKGTEMHSAIYNNLTETSQMEEGSALAQSAVQFYKTNIDPSTTLNDSEIVSLLKKNANDILETTNQIKTSYNEIEKIFGDIDPEAKKSIAFNRIIGEDFKIRKDQLQKEYNKLKLEVKSTQGDEKTPLDETGKKLIASYGSIKNIKSQLEYRNKQIEAIDEKINFYEKQVNRTKEQEDKLTELKSKKNRLKEEYKETEEWYNSNVLGDKLEDGTQLYNMDDDSIALNEEEIMKLPAQERAVMLAKGLGKAYKVFHSSVEELSDDSKREFKSPYSQEQQKYIDSLVSQLGGIENVQKIIDLAAVEQGIVDNTKEYNKILNNKKSLEDYIHQVKFNAKVRAAKERINPILEAGSYEDFIWRYNDLAKNASDFEKKVAGEALRNNDYYKKYRKSQGYLTRVANHVVNEKTTIDEIRAYPAIIKYLLDKGITNESSNEEIISKLLEANYDGTSNLTNYIKNFNSETGANIDIALLNSIVSKFKDALNNYTSNKAVVDAATSSPQPTNNNASAVKKDNPEIDETSKDNEPITIISNEEKKYLSQAKESIPEGFNIDDNLTLEYLEDLKELSKFRMIQQGLSSELSPEDKAIVDAKVQELQEKINQKYKDVVVVNEYSDTPALAYKQEVKAIDNKPTDDNEDAPEDNSNEHQVVLSESDRIYNKLVIQAYVDEIRGRITKNCKVFGPLMNVNEQLAKFNEFMNSIKDKVFTSPDEFSQYLLDNVDSLTKGSIAWNTAKEVAKESLNKNSGKFTEVRRAAREKANEEAKKSPIELVEDSPIITTNEIVLDNPINDTTLPPNHPLKAWFRQFASIDKAINLTLLKRIPGQSTNIFYYYDKQLDADVANFLGPEEYSQQGSPVIVLYPVDKSVIKDSLKTIEINGIHYIPVGTLPNNNNSDFGSLTESIRGKIGNRDNSHLIEGVSSGNRVKAEPMISNTDGSSDVNVRTVFHNSIQELFDEGANEGRPLDAKTREELYNKLIEDILTSNLKVESIADPHNKESTYEALVYYMKDGRPGGQTTRHIFFINNFDNIRNNSGMSMQEYYEQNGTIKGYNGFLNELEKELTRKLSDAVRRNYLPVGDKDFQPFDKSEFATNLNTIIKSYFKSSLAGDYVLKKTPKGKLAIYFKDELLTELNISPDGGSINFEEFFNNLIFPNGKMRSLMTFQVGYNNIIGKLHKKDYKLFKLIVSSGLLRTNINSLYRPKTRITVTIPQGIKPATRQLTLGSDIANSNMESDRNPIITPSGDNVDPDTGRMNNGEIPKNPSKDPLNKALEIVSKMKLDCQKRQAEEKKHLSERKSSNNSGAFGEGTTSDLSHNIPEQVKIPSTNIGNIADVLLRDWLHQFNIRMAKARKGGDVKNARLTPENIDDFINENFEEWEDPESGKIYLRSAKGVEKDRVVYYNFTPNIIRTYLKNSGMVIANYFLDRGFRIYTKDIGVVYDLPMDDGTIKRKIADFDMLAIDENGNFHIFDYKSHTWEDPNAKSSYNADKNNLDAAMDSSWREQVCRYMFGTETVYLEGTGLHVVECAIISNIVGYDNPFTTNYISDDDADEEHPRNKYNRTSKLLVEDKKGKRKDFTQGRIKLDTETTVTKEEKVTVVPKLYHIQTKDYLNNKKALLEIYRNSKTGAKPALQDKPEPGNPVGDNTPVKGLDTNEAVQDFDLYDFTDAEKFAIKGELGLDSIKEVEEWWNYEATTEDIDNILECLGKRK